GVSAVIVVNERLPPGSDNVMSVPLEHLLGVVATRTLTGLSDDDTPAVALLNGGFRNRFANLNAHVFYNPTLSRKTCFFEFSKNAFKPVDKTLGLHVSKNRLRGNSVALNVVRGGAPLTPGAVPLALTGSGRSIGGLNPVVDPLKGFGDVI